jgi:hypothetical protein
MIHDIILSHFEKTLGKSRQSFELPRTRLFEPLLRIYEWDNTSFGIKAFATAGYSQIRITGLPEGHRVEFFMTARRLDLETAVRVLHAATATPLEDKLPPRSGETIGLPLPISGSRGIQRLLVTDRFGDDEFRTINMPNLHVHVLMVVPIFECEFGFLRSNDEAQFWTAVEAERLDITDLSRAPLKRAESYLVKRDTVKAH